MTQHEMGVVAAVEPQNGLARRLAVGTAGAVLSAVALTACGGSSHNSAPNKDTKSASVEALCDSLTFANAAADSQAYKSTAFLPEDASVTSKTEVGPYVNGLFDGNGPLAGKGDEGSLAAVEAIITERATDQTKAVDPKYNYVDQYNRKIDAYNGPDGLGTAKSDCKESNLVMTQVAGYNDAWAAKGEKVTEFVAGRDAHNGITTLSLHDWYAAGEMTGIEYVFRPSAKDVVGGFQSVLETQDGNLWVKGFVPQEQGGESAQQAKHAGKTPSTKAPESTRGNVTGPAPKPNQQENGQTGGGSISAGKTKEQQPGPVSGKHPKGPKGPHPKGTPEATQGPGNTPGGGGQGGGKPTGKPTPQPKPTQTTPENHPSHSPQPQPSETPSTPQNTPSTPPSTEAPKPTAPPTNPN